MGEGWPAHPRDDRSSGDSPRALPAPLVFGLYGVALALLAAIEPLRLDDAIVVPSALIGLSAVALAARGLRRAGDYGLRPGRPRDECAALGAGALFLALLACFFLLGRAAGLSAGPSSPLPRTAPALLGWLRVWGLFTLVAAIPEELFFRGFLHKELERFDRGTRTVLGARIGRSVLLVNVLFAVAHGAVHLRPADLAVFLPGLIFGWLRVRGGSLLAPVVVHGLYDVAIHALRGGL